MRIIFASCLLPDNTAHIHKADLDIADRSELNTVIKDFMRNNPEVVRDALISLADREEAEHKQTGFAKGGMIWVTLDPDGKITVCRFSIITAVTASVFLKPYNSYCTTIQISDW